MREIKIETSYFHLINKLIIKKDKKKKAVTANEEGEGEAYILFKYLINLSLTTE